MVSWWSGDGNDGTLQNGTTFAQGEVGQSFSFDGVNDYVEVADAPNLDITGPITIDARIKTSGTNDWSGIVLKGAGISPHPGYYLYVNPDSKFRCEIVNVFPSNSGNR